MIVFDILKFNSELLNKLARLGLKQNDYKYVGLYIDYDTMRKNGDKITYIVSVLSQKYDVSERCIYNIVKRLGKDCSNYSV